MSRFRDTHHRSYYNRSLQDRIQTPTAKERVVLTQNRCQDCGRDRINDPCGECRNEDLEDFRKIREFIQHNPRSTPLEVANGTKISISKIMRLIR